MLARRPRRYCAAGPVLLALSAWAVTGCTPQRDPAFNPYAHQIGDRPALDALQHAADQLADGVDNIDRRLENVLY